MRRVSYLSRLCVVVLLLILCMSTTTAVLAKECALVQEMAAWQHAQGMFRSQRGASPSPSSAQWHEYDTHGRVLARFTELQRDHTHVLLYNAERHISIVLQADLSGVKKDGESNFQQLHTGHFVPVYDCT